MYSKTKSGIAMALILLALVTAPAVRCLSFLYQNTPESHSCCPHEKADPTVIPTCCLQTPAMVSQHVHLHAPAVTGALLLVQPVAAEIAPEVTFVAIVDDSPPDCSSVLRI